MSSANRCFVCGKFCKKQIGTGTLVAARYECDRCLVLFSPHPGITSFDNNSIIKYWVAKNLKYIDHATEYVPCP
jgi:hypothetical protein